MSAAVAAILEGMPEPRDLRMHEHDGRCVIMAGSMVLFDYAAGDVVMRNIALAALRQLGFRGRVVAAALGLTENYVATLWNAAKRDGSAALVRHDRPGAPGKVTPEQWELARAWRAQGASDAEIGRRLKVAHTTISRGLGPRGQAPDAGEGEPGWAPAEPLFTGPEAGAAPERRGWPEAVSRLRPGRGLSLVLACRRLAAGCRRGGWPAEGVFWSRYAGAMLLHAFFARADAGRVLAAAARRGRAGRRTWRCCRRSACASRWARPRSSSSSTWPPPRPGRWPGWGRCRGCGRCGRAGRGSPTRPTR